MLGRFIVPYVQKNPNSLCNMKHIAKLFIVTIDMLHRETSGQDFNLRR